VHNKLAKQALQLQRLGQSKLCSYTPHAVAAELALPILVN